MKIMSISDRAQVSGTRKTADGYLVADVRVARGGNVQDYMGFEIDEAEPNRIYKIWRPEDEIFKASTLSTFAHRPVTLDHPEVGVTADNWRQEAVGLTGGDVVRDGEFVRVPMMIADAKAIAAVENGTREISMGYDCELVMQAGITPDGVAYDGYQRNHRMNHAAIVEIGRAGPQCRIGDSARRNKEEKTMTKSVTIDGKAFEVADDVAALLAGGKVQEALIQSAKQLGDAQSALAAANARADVAEKAAKDAKAELEQVKASTPTADAIAKMVADHAAVIDAAKAIAPNLEIKGKDAAAIKREVVEHRLGDVAKGQDAAYIAAAFDMLGKAKSESDPLASAIKSAADHGTTDAVAKANNDYDAYLANAWKGAAGKAA